MKTELENIWASEYFITGHKYFQLYNYNFFRIIEKAEFQELNPNNIQPDKQIFAVADATNGDREHSAYLYFDNQQEISIQSNSPFIAPVKLKKIAGNLTQLFGEKHFSEVLITLTDENFWEWYEGVYHSYKIEASVPKGVLPGIDLRSFFNDTFPDTFLSDYKEININAFIQYFENFGVVDLDTEQLFRSRPMQDDFNAFIHNINSRLNENVFYVVFFNPSSFWGIGNYKLLTADQKLLLQNYGLVD